MAEYVPPLRDIRFVLEQLIDLDGLSKLEAYAHADPETVLGVIEESGQFMAEVAAGPVYELLGKKGLGTAEMPPIGTALISGELAFRQHEGGHTDGPNWPAFLQFASRYMSGN